MPSTFSIDTARAGSAWVITINGELDLATAPQLEQALGGVNGDGVERIVIDLTGLSFIDSSGLRTLLLAKRGNLPVSVVLSDGPVRRTFEVAGTLELLDIHERLEDALQAPG